MASKRVGNSCYDKADMDEPLFILRAQDVTSMEVVMRWVELNKQTCPPAKLAEALRCAAQMAEWKVKKEAD